ncbi:MAG: winged helix-turn-helix domain-containing protein [Nanopusillaceae archaeon]
MKKIDKKKILKILLLVEKGMSINQISFQLDISKPLLTYHFKKFLNDGLVELECKYPKIYRLTEKGKEYIEILKSELSSESVKKLSGAYVRSNIAIKLSIIKDNPNVKFEREVEINNWIKEYTRVNFLIPLTLEKTTKSVIVHIDKFEIEKKHFFSELFSKLMKILFFVYTYLKNKYDIEVDILNPKIIRQEFANYSPEFEGVVEKNVKIEIDLGRKAKNIFDELMDANAKAWIDRSFNVLEIETNDKSYEEKLLLMPENIDKLIKKIELLENNNVELYNKFIKILEEMTKILEINMKEIKLIEKILENLASYLLFQKNKKLDENEKFRYETN